MRCLQMQATQIASHQLPSVQDTGLAVHKRQHAPSDQLQLVQQQHKDAAGPEPRDVDDIVDAAGDPVISVAVTPAAVAGEVVALRAQQYYILWDHAILRQAVSWLSNGLAAAPSAMKREWAMISMKTIRSSATMAVVMKDAVRLALACHRDAGGKRSHSVVLGVQEGRQPHLEGRKVGGLEALLVAVDGADGAGPALLDAQVPLARPLLLLQQHMGRAQRTAMNLTVREG